MLWWPIADPGQNQSVTNRQNLPVSDANERFDRPMSDTLRGVGAICLKTGLAAKVPNVLF